MTVKIINPQNKLPLHYSNDKLSDSEGNTFPIINGVARIAEFDNYTKSFGVQWNKFDKTQLDRDSDGLKLSQKRFFKESGWNIEDLNGKEVLEVGSGAGRFSRVILEHTLAKLYSVDYSNAVDANFKNNSPIAADRFHLFQASIYDLPFQDEAFDKVFCFGVLQHTPNFRASVEALISKVKPGGELVVDFYPLKGWWTKIHSKYIVRPFTKKISHDKLFEIIESNVDWLIKISKLLNKFGLGAFTRFLPIVDLRTLPNEGLCENQFREWVILDTFDMLSPEYDQPQKISQVAEIFASNGMKVTFAGFVEIDKRLKSAVVRGIKEL